MRALSDRDFACYSAIRTLIAGGYPPIQVAKAMMILERTDDDLDDAMRQCLYVEWRQEQDKFTDDDLRAAGLPVG